MESQDVDGTTLAPDIERDLGRDLPACRAQEFQGTIDEAGVPSVEQPIETFALPQQPDVDPCVQGGGDADQRVNRHTVGSSSLDAPNDRTRHAGMIRE